ncbi:MAG TPA: 23S rRNA (adenine(2503)-C(2))-methyltransferase RlmN, partial [Clostridiales bacterium]|nr:23S rRNA (adenine(2503)-C(2))-methyltransferase RlmN [Clostridiales bacterium]
MKKILQDLSFEELENLILSLGEKKFRTKQLYEGLMRGKKISEINISAELRSELLK